MPRFNRVLEELNIKHDEYVVPAEVLVRLDKKKDATIKNVTAAVEARKGRVVVLLK